jgi:deoxyribodipyrimidine photo-lyase
MTSTSTPVIWVHGDDLSPENAALAAHPGAPAIFVFDDAALERYRVTLKRIAFIYECLLELPVDIRRGDPAAEVVAFAREHDADGIVTTPSPAPGFSRIVRSLEASLPVEIVAGTDFVPDLDYDLARFSRFWRNAERFAMAPTDPD